MFGIIIALILALFLQSAPAAARDLGQWEYQPTYVRQWFQKLMQPDNPVASCCGEADAYWADSFEVNDGRYVAIITDERPDGPLGRPRREVGEKIVVPNNKIKWMKEIQPDTESSLKLGANTLTATTLQCMGEVLALLRKGGIGGRLAFDVLTNSLFDSRVHKSYGGKIVEGRFSPAGMAVPLATKDLRLALAEAEHTAVPMPAASLVHDRLVAMAARGWSDLDWSALGLLAAADAGLGDGR
jgi:hypothetical protein